MIGLYVKKLAGYSLFFLLTASANAQTEGPDIVEVKSGEKHRGLIVEQRPGNYLRLVQQPSQDTLKLAYSEIVALYKSTDSPGSTGSATPVETIPKSETSAAPPVRYNQRSLYAGISSAVGGGDWANLGIGAQLHYTVLPSLKAGVSLQFYWGNGTPKLIDQALPLSLDVLYTLQTSNSGRMSLLAAGSIGCAFVQQRGYFNTKFGQEAELSRGLFFSASLGGQVHFTRNSGLRVEVGYQHIGARGFALGTDDFLQRHTQSNIFLRGTVFF